MMASFVLAKKSSNDIVFFKHPNLIVRELRDASKVAQDSIHLEGFHYMIVERAEQEIKQISLKDG